MIHSISGQKLNLVWSPIELNKNLNKWHGWLQKLFKTTWWVVQTHLFSVRIFTSCCLAIKKIKKSHTRLMLEDCRGSEACSELSCPGHWYQNSLLWRFLQLTKALIIHSLRINSLSFKAQSWNGYHSKVTVIQNTMNSQLAEDNVYLGSQFCISSLSYSLMWLQYDSSGHYSGMIPNNIPQDE